MLSLDKIANDNFLLISSIEGNFLGLLLLPRDSQLFNFRWLIIVSVESYSMSPPATAEPKSSHTWILQKLPNQSPDLQSHLHITDKLLTIVKYLIPLLLRPSVADEQNLTFLPGIYLATIRMQPHPPADTPNYPSARSPTTALAF